MRRSRAIHFGVVILALTLIERWFYVPTPRQVVQDWRDLGEAISYYKEHHP